jgi:hypothetical protein
MNYFSVFLAFMIATAAIVMTGAAVDREHALQQQQELRYLQPAEDLARAEIQTALAAQVEASPGATIQTISLPTGSVSVCGTTSAQAAPCPSFTVAATIQGKTTVGAAGVGTDECSNANESAALGETCVSVLMTVNLTGSHGSPLATRTEKVTYRVLDAEPYAIQAGAADLVSGAAVGEANANGCNPSVATTCLASPPPGTLTDTRFHSYTECKNGLTLCQGTDPDTGMPYGYREGSNFQSQGYTDGNQSSGTWNQ